MDTSEKQLIGRAFHLLKFGGANPDQSRLFLLIPTATNIVRVYLTYLAIKLLGMEFGNLTVFIGCMEGLSTFIQGFAKLVPLLFYRDKVSKVLRGLDNFWPTKAQYKPWFKFFTFYKFMIIWCYCVIVANGMYNKELQFLSYIPNIPFGFVIIFVAQTILISTDLIFIIGMDLVFIGSCVVIKKQFELLQRDLLNFDVEEDLDLFQKRFKGWIKHHIYMIDYTTNVTEVFQHCLFIQYFISTYCICIQLYLLTESTELTELIKSAFYVGGITFQLSLFCFPAEEISQITSNIAKSVYDTNWYSFPLENQKDVPFIMTRSQRPVQFKAGGMMPINREAFTLIFKSSVSFYTVVKSLKEEK